MIHYISFRLWAGALICCVCIGSSLRVQVVSAADQANSASIRDGLSGGLSVCANRDGALSDRSGSNGTVTFDLDAGALEALGLGLIAHGQLNEECQGHRIVFGITTPPTLEVESQNGVLSGIGGGSVRTRGAMLLYRPSGRVVIGNLMIEANSNGALAVKSTLEPGDSERALFELESVMLEFQRATGELRLIGELALSSSWVAALDLPEAAAGAVVGTVVIEAQVGEVGDTDVSDVLSDNEGTWGSDGRDPGLAASDVIVGALYGVYDYGSVGDIHAFAVGTISCNVGSARVSWVSYTNQHPVILQDAYRLMDDRFEQIGLAWLKHGFYAVSGSFCGSCTDYTDGTELGVGCSDPYSAYLNGIQTNMSPRSIVNADTGYFPYPWSVPAPETLIERRLQIHDTDLDPALNPGARYFVQGHYILPDDALAATSNNNASYREVLPTNTAPGVFGLAINQSWTTRIGQPAVRAWQDVDGSVDEVDIQIPGEGLFILAAKATYVDEGIWRYSYALQNLNSDRSGGWFSIPLPDGAVVSYAGFHDVDYHSGEIYDLTDWTHSVVPGSITWFTDTFAANENANALRYGTVYNFYLDINSAPGPTSITVGLFKPGDPASVSAESIGPVPMVDCNGNFIDDRDEIAAGTGSDCNNNGVLDECDLEDGTSEDVNWDEIPDECQIPDPPLLPFDYKLQARKHRYLSINPSTNAPNRVAIKVEVAEMRRCTGDPLRACLTDDHCRNGATGPCVDRAPLWGRSPGQTTLSWIVQQPFQEPEGCIPSCADDDWIARLSDTVYSDDWSEYSVLHIGDCPIVPCVTYKVYACDPVATSICSDPLVVATQVFAATTGHHFGDVAGTTMRDLEISPPDGATNVADLLAYLNTKKHYGTAALPQAHRSRMDLHGLGVGIPPNMIMNVADLSAIFTFGWKLKLPWMNTQGGLEPGDCP